MCFRKYGVFWVILSLGMIGIPFESEAGVSFSFNTGRSCGKSYHHYYRGYGGYYGGYYGYPRYRSYCAPRTYRYTSPYYCAPSVTVERHYVYPQSEPVYRNDWYQRGNGYPSANPKYQTAEPDKEPREASADAREEEEALVLPKKEEKEEVSQESEPTISRSFAQSIQKKLRERGFFHGDIDGVMGKSTRDAIRGLQRASGFKETGQLDIEVLQDLGFLKNNTARKIYY